MLNIYRTVDNECIRTDTLEEGIWVNLANPSDEEIISVNNAFNVEMD